MAKASSNNGSSFDSEKAESQIDFYKRIVDFDIKEYPIEVIVQKYTQTDPNVDKPEFYIPDYQRELTWDQKKQSRFIESILIGLPIPFLTFAEVDSEEGQLEIVDGSQRVRTLNEYLSNRLILKDLEKLTVLNGSCFDNLPLFRQRKFKRSTIRIIVLSSNADEEARRDIFERINTGSDPLNDMERRRGVMRGPFIDFLEECAQNELFNKLVHVSDPGIKRREKEEFILRFFAYRKNYLNFQKEVCTFLDTFIKSVQGAPIESVQEKRDENPRFTPEQANEFKSLFVNMLEFIDAYFPNGFSRKGKTTVPRIRFEALAVGASLALEQNPQLVPQGVETWVDSEEFLELTTSDASNSRPKVKKRIEYVRNKLLGETNE